MNIYIVLVKSKIFKKPPKNDWFEARIEIDSANKKLLFSLPRESNELYEEYETGEPSKEAEAAAQQPTIEPQSIELSEFRPPKLKGDGKETTKKGETIYRMELPGRSRVSGKSLKISCQDQTMFQEFYRQLRPHFNLGPDGTNSASVISLAQLGRNHSSESKKALQPQSELLEFGGGVYATVMGEGDNGDEAGQEQMEMIVVTSSIYEAFELERCFQVSFDFIRSDFELSSALKQIKTGDPLHLYIGPTKLELLNREKCPLCDWPLTQIRSFKHNEQQVQLDVGTRTVTGRSLLSFKFDSFGPSAGARFAQVLSAHLNQPPECGCRCRGRNGSGKQRSLMSGADRLAESNASLDADDASEDDDEANVGDEAGDDGASSDGLCSNPCYYEDDEQLGSLESKRAEKKSKRGPGEQQQQRREQQRKRMLRQTRMKSAEPDYYSSVVRKPQAANKPSLAAPSSAAVAAAAAAIAASAESSASPPQSQQRTLNRQASADESPAQSLPPSLPPREASADLAAGVVPDDAYESIVAIPPAGYTDADDKFVMQFSDKFSQQQLLQRQKMDKKVLKAQKKAKK